MTDWLTHWLTDTQTDFIICPMLLTHRADKNLGRPTYARFRLRSFCIDRFCLLAERRLGPRHWPRRTYGRNTTDDVLYNKFNVDSSSPPQSPSRLPNSDYNCAVATTGQWRVARCTEKHLVVCQLDYNTSPGTHNYYDNVYVTNY